MKPAKPADVDAYIGTFPAATQKLLKQLRSTIRKSAPGATEVISYSMPAYRLNGMLLYFSGFSRHIGFYPFRSAIKKFAPQLKKYKTSTGTVQFPLDKPLPVKLVSAMVKFRVKENREKMRSKAK
jgi:uncharacterized protein YdhG (YjbR/CyaY superfamily)